MQMEDEVTKKQMKEMEKRKKLNRRATSEEMRMKQLISRCGCVELISRADGEWGEGDRGLIG